MATKDQNKMDNITERAWRIYNAISKCPTELQSLCQEILFMIGALVLVNAAVKDGQCSSLTDILELGSLENGCETVISSLEIGLGECRSHKKSLRTLLQFKESFSAETSNLTSFSNHLQRNSQDKIVKQLDQIRDIKSEEFQKSMITDRAALLETLERLGLSKQLLEDESFFIDNWLKENFPNSEEARNLLPDYEQGSEEPLIAEKAQVSNEINPPVSEPSRTTEEPPIIAEPPPYTFDDGSDRLEDSDFLEHIRQAIEIEHLTRQSHRQKYPNVGPHPWGWLPPRLHAQYRVMEDVIPMLEQTSFGAMAYESAPRCANEIERLVRLMRSLTSSSEHVAGESTVDEALYSLNVMNNAVTKFSLLAAHDSHAPSEQFSDLDSLAFEYSTAHAIDPQVSYPEEEFLLIQKSYYNLLTYIMGFLHVFQSIYPGVLYTPRVMQSLWKDNNMTMRAAWVQKQLAGWSKVEEAVIACRAFNYTRSNLGAQALAALKEWQSAKKVLVGADGLDEIEMTVISASALPKSSFRLPSTYAKVTYFGTNKFGSPARGGEWKTDISQKTQSPAWDKTFPIKIYSDSRMIDIEIFDQIAGMAKQVAKARLLFSFIPGVEIAFLDRSLMRSVDEQVAIPLTVVEGKGKEKEQPVLQIHLTWKGRINRVEELGLPSKAPGKMFRQDFVLPIFDPSEDFVGRDSVSSPTRDRSGSMAEISIQNIADGIGGL